MAAIEYPWVEVGNGMAMRCEWNGTGYDVILRSNQTNQTSYVLLATTNKTATIRSKEVWI